MISADEPGPAPAASAGAVPPRGTVVRDIAIGAGTVLLAAFALVDHGIGARGFIAAFFLAVLAVLSVIDVEKRILPNVVVFPAAGIILVAQLAFFPDQWLDWIAAPLGAAAFFLGLRLVYKEGLGLGDVKLMLLLGVGLGKTVGLAVFLGAVAAGLFGAFLLVKHGRSARKMGIPFGPFLAIGAAVAVFVADPGSL